MLQAHSFFWNYLWISPNAYLLLLGILLIFKGIGRQRPAFATFAVLSSLGGLCLYAADVLPSVSPVNFWRVDWITLSLESILKFAAIGEAFSRLFNRYSSISKLGKYLVSAVGAILVFVATMLAAFSSGDSTVRLISGVHLLDLTVFAIECGLILFIYALAAYFRIPWDRHSFGTLLGFGVSSCVYLATSAIVTNANPSAYQRTLFDFSSMATYHVTVLIWFYFFLVPGKNRDKKPPKDDSDRRNSNPPASPGSGSKEDEASLQEWNRELERLIHQ